MLACPNCRTEELAEFVDRSGVALDSCPRCRGLWFDSGELSRLLGKPAEDALRDPKPGQRPCARCSLPMPRGAFLNPLLVVDRCEPCGGVWLDASELRVIRRLLGVEGPTDAESAPHAPEARPLEPSPAPEPTPTPASTSAFVGSWRAHGGFWLFLGIATIAYGRIQYFEWEAVTSAGGLAGPAPKHLLGLGAAMTAAGVYFLMAQPRHASDGYMAAIKWLLRPRRNYLRRSRMDWYDSRF